MRTTVLEQPRDQSRVRERFEGRYQVRNRELRLNGIAGAPLEFWIVRSIGDRCLIEITEEESFWVLCEEITRAITEGWITRAHDEIW